MGSVCIARTNVLMCVLPVIIVPAECVREGEGRGVCWHCIIGHTRDLL